MFKRFFCCCGAIGHILHVERVKEGLEFTEYKLEKTGCENFVLSDGDFDSLVELHKNQSSESKSILKESSERESKKHDKKDKTLI